MEASDEIVSTKKSAGWVIHRALFENSSQSVVGADELLRRTDDTELPTEGVALGSIQVPPSGQPVVFLADHPITGGYPVVGVVADADIDRLGQARPGQHIRFVRA